MKILFVSIPNHHFFQWVDQLKDAGHEIYWFDITDGGDFVKKLDWTTQIKKWKLKYDFPFRHTIKSKFPGFYSWLQKINERNASTVFEHHLLEIQPDVVHCFEMQLSGIPLLEILKKHTSFQVIYSSWGSDLFSYQKLGVSSETLQDFLKRADYLITDCQRDKTIALESGFENKFLGVFPGNGGIKIPTDAIQKTRARNTILIKGYDDKFGKASKIIEALLLIDHALLKNFKIVVYSADSIVEEMLLQSDYFQDIDWKVYARGSFLNNTQLLKLMGESIVHIGNSISDGMPNALLEAMGMGAFPIQSNPGNASAEVIVQHKNGFLIENPLDEKEIADLLFAVLQDYDLRENAQAINVAFIEKNYNRDLIKTKIIDLYKTVFTAKN